MNNVEGGDGEDVVGGSVGQVKKKMKWDIQCRYRQY